MVWRIVLLLFFFVVSSFLSDERFRLAEEIDYSIRYEMLNKWYPKAVDKEYGGFLSTFTFDFKPTGQQDKQIVTQARHTWSNAKASLLYPSIPHYKTGAKHGFQFLKDFMWDKKNGGFYQFVDRKGVVKKNGYQGKTAYGNSFALFALAAYYQASGDTSALNLAKKTFLWLEKHSHDPEKKGYFQSLSMDGTPIKRDKNTPIMELGFKDQNSSIHLLESFTELYQVWPDALIAERLQELLQVIRDTIVTKKGHMQMFFFPDWTPFSLQDSTEEIKRKYHYFDHVSFGHDVETAYLLIEASHVLGLEQDSITLRTAKRMVDHALRNGWDNEKGGFYEEGYYYKNQEKITITKDTKNWWSQAEGLNTLLLMADLYPKDEMNYFDKFQKLWTYCKTYLIDHENGDWYEEGLDQSPDKKASLKGHIWKANYHQFRGLSSCLLRLKPDSIAPPVPSDLKLSALNKQVKLTWSAVKDDHLLLGYEIFQNGKKIGFTPRLSYAATYSAKQSSDFSVRSIDLHGNHSDLVAFKK